MEKITKILIISSDLKLREVLDFCFDGWGYDVVLWDSYEEGLTAIKRVFPDVIVIDVQSASISDLKICGLLKKDFLTSSIPVITLINKRQLRNQLLNLKQGVDDYLIKPPDPLDLRIRIEMAIKRSHVSLHANPLTGLPGARVIEEVLKDKIKGKSVFSIGYVDIDNFKSFNDVYGYIKGDDIIMHTAYMLYRTVITFGNSDDFIAHIGGDDFIFVTTPDKFDKICQNFIFLFDRVIPFHYTSQHQKQGFMITRDRARNIKKIPLMSVSIAGVNVRKNCGIDNMVQINEKIAEIKRYLKTMCGSIYMADRRTSEQDRSLEPRIHKTKDITHFYKPLGQILVEKNIITCEQLESALRIHWRKGILLGEVLRELGWVSSKQLEEVLKVQKTTVSKFS